MSDLNPKDDHSFILDDNLEGKAEKARPTFLTVLCILSFVGNGLGILQGLVIWSMSGVYSSVFTSLSQNSQVTNYNTVSSVFNGIAWLAVIFILSSVICIAGAVFMWKLKKMGFFIYLFGQIAPVVTVFLFFVSLKIPESVTIGLIYSIMLSIFPLAFIIMYAVNLKHLK